MSIIIGLHLVDIPMPIGQRKEFRYRFFARCIEQFSEQLILKPPQTWSRVL
jgi:hypothetical protein